MNKDQLGQFVKNKRTEQKMSQTQLGDSSGIGYQRVLEIEKNKKNYSVEVLMAVAKILGYELSFVPIDFDKRPSPPFIINVKNWGDKVAGAGVQSVKFNFKTIPIAQLGDENSKTF